MFLWPSSAAAHLPSQPRALRSGRDAAAIDGYITSYMCKGELTVNNIFQVG